MRNLIAIIVFSVMFGCSRKLEVFEADYCRDRPILIVRVDSLMAKIMAPGVLGEVALDSLALANDSVEVVSGRGANERRRKISLTVEQKKFAKEIVPKLKSGIYERGACRDK